MPFTSNSLLFKGILLCIAVPILCSAYAYFLDVFRSQDDPQKRNYPWYAWAGIFLSPVTLPVFILLWCTLFLLRVLFYGTCLILFFAALIVVREPFFLKALHKTASSIGDKLLQANTMLLRIFLKPLLDTGRRQ